MLLHPRLDVIVLVPHAHLDAVRGIVTFAVTQKTMASGQNNHTDTVNNEFNQWSEAGALSGGKDHWITGA